MKNPKTLFFVNIIAGTLIVLSGIHNLGLLDAEGFQGWGIPQIIAVVQIACGPSFFWIGFKKLNRK
tara:strand:- start:78310 stop:78507 length:198 start_codon:yes stop_codon:yes gene_type:complete